MCTERRQSEDPGRRQPSTSQRQRPRMHPSLTALRKSHPGWQLNLKIKNSKNHKKTHFCRLSHDVCGTFCYGSSGQTNTLLSSLGYLLPSFRQRLLTSAASNQPPYSMLGPQWSSFGAEAQSDSSSPLRPQGFPPPSASSLSTTARPPRPFMIRPSRPIPFPPAPGLSLYQFMYNFVKNVGRNNHSTFILNSPRMETSKSN